MRPRPPAARALSLALSLALSFALCSALCATLGYARAQAPPDSAVVEGPPDADVVLDGVERALDLIVAGDKAWKDGPRDAAFDAWRSAIVASRDGDSTFGGGTVVAPPPGPGTDVDGTLARRAEDCAWTVRRRLALITEPDRVAWSARFEPLAEIERIAAGNVPELLARVQREFPRTRAAARAALALCDLAWERGEPYAARAWLQRAQMDSDSELADAIARRAFEPLALEPLALEPLALDSLRGAEGPSLRVERVVELGSADGYAHAAIPGIAIARQEIIHHTVQRMLPVPAAPADRAPGTTWFHGGGRLLRFDAQGDATAALDVIADLRAQGVAASIAFSEPGAPWDEAFAWSDGVIALVEGRAREDRGNALVSVDARDRVRVNWIRDSNGLVRDGVRVVATDLARVPALLEFQPGPILVSDTLVVHVRAWPRSAEGASELDEARVESWCAGLDPRDGELRWSRRLATGSTLRGLDRGRMSPSEPTTLPALSPLDAGGRVALDTGLGAVAILDAVDGRPASIVRTARRGTRATGSGGIAASWGDGPVWFAPDSSAGALLRLRSGPDEDGRDLFTASPLVLGGPRIPVSKTATGWTSLAPSPRGATTLVTQDLESGMEVRSAEIPFVAAFERGSIAAAPSGNDWLVSAGGRAYLLDAGLRSRMEVELGPRSEFARIGIAVGTSTRSVEPVGRLVRIAGPNRIVFLSAQ